MTIIDGADTRKPDGSHRVVVTGTGAISPAGVGAKALWDAVMGKRCCIGPITRFDSDPFEVNFALSIPVKNPTDPSAPRSTSTQNDAA